MPNSNPDWQFNQVPTVAEWNFWFGVKQDWSPSLDAVINQGGPIAYQAAQTWTPDDASGGALVFTDLDASVSVVGNLCFASFTLTFPTTADTNTVLITGIPFRPLGGDNYTTANLVYKVGGAAYNAIVTIPLFAVDQAGFALTTLAGVAVTNATLSGAVLRGQVAFPLS